MFNVQNIRFNVLNNNRLIKNYLDECRILNKPEFTLDPLPNIFSY